MNFLVRCSRELDIAVELQDVLDAHLDKVVNLGILWKVTKIFKGGENTHGHN